MGLGEEVDVVVWVSVAAGWGATVEVEGVPDRKLVEGEREVPPPRWETLTLIGNVRMGGLDVSSMGEWEIFSMTARISLKAPLGRNMLEEADRRRMGLTLFVSDVADGMTIAMVHHAKISCSDFHEGRHLDLVMLR